MPNPLTIWDYEDKQRKPTVRLITIGKMIARVFNVPGETARTLEPARGTCYPGTSGLTAERVKHIRYGQKLPNNHVEMIIDFIKPEAYA